ncbi:divalent-cation tolerance protein CutA [Alteromonas lipolytica]|uniref:Divalent-cation tolerance protein CutA n=1 Tax=Alteromonas lipolytica TaxID=1856405 RepID=A0A1E8FHZ0_9ALTE|nr:divalent-cation tolerance protein CutA [Alteromonas lipolytica]OFI35552.1 hypothetical protein BFC17_12380 [Alteromonas lipolytica]GGF77138.1 divalent-cation tolerance protein CutA [Alteromonas lipolytica]
MTDICIVHCTTDSQENAEVIATQLIEQRLAACVQIVPGITSVYRWDNKLAQDQEWLLLIKTHRQLLDRAEQLVNALHSYDVPQWVVVAAETVSPAYGTWVEQELNIEKRN